MSHCENEVESDIESDSGPHENAKAKRGDLETWTTSSIANANISCPFTILAKYAKGPFEPKSPLRQFAINYCNG